MQTLPHVYCIIICVDDWENVVCDSVMSRVGSRMEEMSYLSKTSHRSITALYSYSGLPYQVFDHAVVNTFLKITLFNDIGELGVMRVTASESY